MTDPAAQIFKEAKSLYQGLKESLKTRDFSDREVDIQRKNLRRQYLRLLFVHPYARESKDAEAHLWIQTSYTLISIYKQRIASLDRSIHHPPRQGGQQQPSRTVEYRRLLQRFRQFLSEEEKFWTQLVLRFRRHFALDEAQPALNALGIVPEDDPAPTADGAQRRNQYQFPPESEIGSPGAAAALPTTQAQRESRVAILSKALVCLGDIARYKEQYNEAGGRPRAGHEDGPPAAASASRSGRGRRGGGPAQNLMTIPRLRNYDRAQSCYEQARLLLPYDGNPSHQLAILSSYQKDVFSSLVHYYRALCVRTPYETASENMGTILSKALEQYRTRGLVRETERQTEMATGAPAVPRTRVEAFKEKVVVLHAQWNSNVDEAKSMGESVVEDFAGLVTDRILPIDMISKVVVLAEGALWKHRMLRRPLNGEKRGARVSSTESHIVTHLIATHRVLLENGCVELTESPPEDAVEHDLAQRITATFRRTLPALRMAGKWLRSNTRYISQGRKAAIAGQEEVVLSRDPNKKRNASAPVIIIGGIDEFWERYVIFCDSLIHAFPVENLPELKSQLEEDIEMAGFLPLRKYMYGSDGKPPGASRASTTSEGDRKQTASVDSQDRALGRDQVHPNEEQLMRIADILLDAKAVAEDENTPVVFENESFIFREPVAVAETPHIGATNGRPVKPLNGGSAPYIPTGRAPQTTYQMVDEDDNISITTRTDDDPVRDAFKEALGSLEDNSADEEDDRIVWQPSAPLSPQQDPVFTALPTTPPKMSPIGTAPKGMTPRKVDALSPLMEQLDIERSPPMATPKTVIGATTADDLLNSVLGINRTPGASHHTRGTSGPPLNLLFGSGGPGNSIWSSSVDPPQPSYARTNLASARDPIYASQVTQSPGPPLPPTQSTMTSSQLWQSPLPAHNTQLAYLNGSRSTNDFLPQQSNNVNGMHHRLPSETFSPLRNMPPLPQYQRYDNLNPSAHLAEPAHASTNNILGRLGPSLGEIYSSPAAPPPMFYRQPQTDIYGLGSSQSHLRREPTFQAPFQAPSISNIWGSPG